MIWGIRDDAKRFIAEDIVVYAALLVLCYAWDIVYRMHDLSVNAVNVHPWGFGTFQLLGAVFFTVQLVRSLVRMRYYQ